MGRVTRDPSPLLDMRAAAAPKRRAGSAALLTLALLGGCAVAPPPGSAGAVATRSPVVPCSTTWLVLATVSKCGSDGFKLGVATE